MSKSHEDYLTPVELTPAEYEYISKRRAEIDELIKWRYEAARERQRAERAERERDGYLSRLDEVNVERQRQEVRAINAERERDEARKLNERFRYLIRNEYESGGDVGASLADLFVVGFNLGRNSVADLS